MGPKKKAGSDVGDTKKRKAVSDSQKLVIGKAGKAAVASTPAATARRGRGCLRVEAPTELAVEKNGRSKRLRRSNDAEHGGRGASEEAAPPHNRVAPADYDSSARDAERLMESVVKVFCTHSEPNFSLPWQRKRQYQSSSSGFVIAQRRILTNAHSVDHHTQVKVRRRGSDEKFLARVLAVGTECDIAMLTVDDEGFWEGLEPVRMGQLPHLQQQVTVIGYPIGGDTMSVTSGVVSRIEVLAYVHGASELLGIQIDAAINSGNSGGPAFNNRGECVGIAFQSLKHEDAENIGYVIPNPVIEHFLTDFDRNGTYTAFPSLGIEWQKLESKYLRSSLKMKAEQKGVLIRRVEPTSEAHKVLQKGDVLLSFDGVDIANDGTVPFRRGERISFSYLISQKYTGEEAMLRYLHNGSVVKKKVKLVKAHRLIPVHIKGRPPPYFIIGGLVFTQVTVPYLRSEYGKEYDFDAPVKLLDEMLHGMAQRRSQQVVVLAHVLASDINIGYEEIVNTQVRSVNGHEVDCLKDVVSHVDGCKADYLRFGLEYNQVVVLATKDAREATAKILETHCIPQDRSADLLHGAPDPDAASAPLPNGTA